MRHLFTWCIVSTLLIGACSQKQEHVNEEPSSPPVVVSEGIPINYEICGEGELTILFVHGWCINQSYWDAQIEALCPSYQVISLDLPGFGSSKGVRDVWSIENYAKDIVAVIDQLDLDQVVLVGHSMGGDIIAEATLMLPEKIVALVGVDNFKDVGVEYSDQDMEDMSGFMVMLEEDFANIAPAYAEGMLFHASTDSLIAHRVMTDIAQTDPEVAVGSLKDLFVQSEQLKGKLGKIDQKLYLINSDATPTFEEGLEASGISFEVNLIHATGHYPMVEKPDEFTEILKEVIGKIEEENG